MLKPLISSLRKQRHDDKGIVTLSDRNYFQGLTMLYRSVQESFPVPIVCFDIGLTDEQKGWAETNLKQLSILPVPAEKTINIIKNTPDDKPLAKRGKRQWPIWICPFLIAASPFRRTFWLDCDIVVLRKLKNLFQMLETGPVFTPENNAPHLTANKPELYELLPIERHFEQDKPVVNGGVSGWNLVRDKAVLEAYMYPIVKAFQDRRVKNAISWWDQGALIWAIQKTGREHRVLNSWEWNLCVKHTKASSKQYSWNRHVLRQLREDVPEANLLHWNGVKVPWGV
jgi:hypothetical protein